MKSIKFVKLVRFYLNPVFVNFTKRIMKMEDNQYIKNVKEVMDRIKNRSAALLEQAKNDGSLNYFFDPDRCKDGELIRVYQGKEEVIKKDQELLKQ